MRILLVLSLLFSIESALLAATFTTTTGGEWSNDAIWNAAPGANDCNSSGNHTFNINHYVTSSCTSLNFTGSITINVASGATFYFSGSGGISGSVNFNIATGGSVIIVGDLALGGSSDVIVNGNLTVNGNITGVGSTFDCNGSTNAGTVSVGGTGCTNCTNAGDAGCSQNVPLPVNLVDLKATSLDNSILVSWSTSFETNNDHFRIQKSVDGKIFHTVHVLNGEKNSETLSNYQFADNDVTSGVYYYRLIQVETDGSLTQSNVVQAKIDGEMRLEVYPNPSSSEQINVSMYNVNAPVLLILMDVNGNTLYSKVHYMDTHSAVLNLNDLYTDLPSGIYYISASSNNQLFGRKLIVY